MKRKGFGIGFGQGYKNLLPMDKYIHSLSAKGIKTKMFTSPVYRETAYGIIDDYGKKKQRMTLKKLNMLKYNIEWEVFDEQGNVMDYVEIGISTGRDNKKKIIDYDGVFELPKQAIDLLKKNGFDTSEVEFDDDNDYKEGTIEGVDLLTLRRVPYGKKGTPKNKREYQWVNVRGSPVGTIDEWKDFAKKSGVKKINVKDFDKDFKVNVKGD